MCVLGGCCGQISVFFGRWGAWGGVFVMFLGYLTCGVVVDGMVSKGGWGHDGLNREVGIIGILGSLGMMGGWA